MRLTTTIKFVLLIFITGFISLNIHAYDGDVDYSAPYVTIDPETGQLVTIDPRAQTKTPHATPGGSNSTTSSNTVDQSESTPSSATTMSQATTDMTQSNTSESQDSSPVLPVIIGLLVAGFAAAFVFRKKADAPASDSSTDQNSSS